MRQSSRMGDLLGVALEHGPGNIEFDLAVLHHVTRPVPLLCQRGEIYRLPINEEPDRDRMAFPSLPSDGGELKGAVVFQRVETLLPRFFGHWATDYSKL